MPAKSEKQKALMIPEDLTKIERGLGLAALNASKHVLGEMGNVVVRGMRQTSRSFASVLPLDLRGVALPDRGFDVAASRSDQNLDIVGRFVLLSDASVEMTRSGVAALMGRTSSDIEADVMAAISSGALVAEEGDTRAGTRLREFINTRFYGRSDTLSKEAKLRILEMLDMSPAFYDLSRVPIIRAVMGYIKFHADIYCSVYVSSAKHNRTYLGIQGDQGDLLDYAQELNLARPELLDMRKQGLMELRTYRKRLMELGRILVSQRDTLPEPEFRRYSAEYEQIRAAMGLASLETCDVNLRLIRELVRERQATTGAMILDTQAQAMAEQIAMEEVLKLVAKEGVVAGLSSISALMMAAARAMRAVVVSNMTGDIYDPTQDILLNRAVDEVKTLLSKYQLLVGDQTKVLANPLDFPQSGRSR